MWSSAMLKEMFRELTLGAIKAISKMSDVSWTGSSRICLFGPNWFTSNSFKYLDTLTSVLRDMFGLTHPTAYVLS